MKISKTKTFVFLMTISFAVSFFCFHVNLVKADTEEEIKDEIADLKKEEKDLLKDLESQNSQLYKNKAQISSTQTLLKEIQANIARSEAELDNLNNRANLNKKILAEYVRQMYYAVQDSPFLSLVIFDGSLSDLTINFDGMAGIKTKISDILKEIEDAKGETEEAKALLASQKQNNQKALQSQQIQQAAIAEDIKETQATLGEVQKKMSQLKNDLNRILGKSYDTGEIKDAIKFANKVTGVRKGFLFGVLSMESGGNPLAGKCTYNNCDMSKARKTYFMEICDELGLSDKKCKSMPLSCASKSYPGSGGAMGAAQFMSDTWAGYKKRIASATGNNPPNPWSLVDGVMAMALKLKNDGATGGSVSIKNPCTGKSVKVSGEFYASMRYLGWNCYGYTNYAPGIQSLAKGYDNL